MATQSPKDDFFQNAKKAAKNELGKVKEDPVEYVKENPIKSTAAFVILPFDWVLGGPISLAIAAGGFGYGAHKLAKDSANKDDSEQKPKKDNRFAPKPKGGKFKV